MVRLEFGVIAIIVVFGWLQQVTGIGGSPLVTQLEGALFMTLPYLMFRLVDDFWAVPRLLTQAAIVGLLATIAAFFVFPTIPLAVTLLIVAYFVVIALYVVVAFVQGARRSSGVTRRRMQAVAAGSAPNLPMQTPMMVPIETPLTFSGFQGNVLR